MACEKQPHVVVHWSEGAEEVMMDAQLIEADEDFLVDDGRLQDLESQFEGKGE